MANIKRIFYICAGCVKGSHIITLPATLFSDSAAFNRQTFDTDFVQNI